MPIDGINSLDLLCNQYFSENHFDAVTKISSTQLRKTSRYEVAPLTYDTYLIARKTKDGQRTNLITFRVAILCCQCVQLCIANNRILSEGRYIDYQYNLTSVWLEIHTPSINSGMIELVEVGAVSGVWAPSWFIYFTRGNVVEEKNWSNNLYPHLKPHLVSVYINWSNSRTDRNRLS